MSPRAMTAVSLCISRRPALWATTGVAAVLRHAILGGSGRLTRRGTRVGSLWRGCCRRSGGMGCRFNGCGGCLHQRGWVHYVVHRDGDGALVRNATYLRFRVRVSLSVVRSPGPPALPAAGAGGGRMVMLTSGSQAPLNGDIRSPLLVVRGRRRRFGAFGS